MKDEKKVNSKKIEKTNKPKPKFKKVLKNIFKTKASIKVPPIIETLFVIIDKEKGDFVCQILNKLKIELKVISRGKGTASSSMASLFGLGSLEKEIIIAVIKLKDSEKILKILNEKLQLEEKRYGIAFTIPIKSATSDLLEEIGYYF